MADALESRGRERDDAEAKLVQAQKMEAIGRLAGGIAHDFNNLLTIIVGAGELMREQEGGNAELDQIRTAAMSAAALTRQLLAFSRKQMLSPRVIDLNVVLTRVAQLVRRSIGEDIRLVTDVASTPCMTYADPHQMEQVILNLALNARDAMPNGGTLTIATGHHVTDDTFVSNHPGAIAGAFVTLTIKDTGTGMDAETKAHVFEPFFTTKDAGKGTGLGLATVYGIVKQSGGYIDVDTTVGQGT